MQMQLSKQNASVLLGALLMHWGVPFSRLNKRPLSIEEQRLLDALSDRLVVFLENFNSSEMAVLGCFQFTVFETVLTRAVLYDCLFECDGDATELRIHLRSESREDVQTLLESFVFHSPTSTNGDPL